MKIIGTIKFLWRRQPDAIKTAIIAGLFSLLVALCGLLPNIVEIVGKGRSRPPHLTAVVVGKSFNWTPLFLSDEPSDMWASVVTDSCLQISLDGGKNVYTKIGPAGSSHLEGKLGVLVMNDQPLVITKIELNILNYESFQVQDTSPVFFAPGRGGGGNPVNEVMVSQSPLKIGPGKQTFILLSDEPYEMPAKGVLTFLAPVEFLQQGFYTYRILVVFHTFHSDSQQTVSSDGSLGWVYIDHLIPERITLIPEDVEEFELQVSECP